MEANKSEWDRLPSESQQAHEAFMTYLYLPSNQRTIVNAYRSYRNSSARKPSDTWSRWAVRYRWRERAQAHDIDLHRIRQRSLEEEAERQARQVEQVRGRFNEILARSQNAVIEYLESDDFGSNIRPRDVINIMRVYFEATRYFGDAAAASDENEIADWTLDEQADFEKLVREIEACDKEQKSKESEEESEDGEESEDRQN